MVMCQEMTIGDFAFIVESRGGERLPVRAPQACCRAQGRARSVTVGRSSGHCIRPSWPLCPVTLLGAAAFTLHFRVRTNDKLGGAPR